MLVIGDEILSGRTRDANMYYLAGALTEIGIDLKEVRVVSDDKAAIIAAVSPISLDVSTEGRKVRLPKENRAIAINVAERVATIKTGIATFMARSSQR